MATLIHALSETVMDELASRDVPNLLKELISLVIRVDNRICE